MVTKSNDFNNQPLTFDLIVVGGGINGAGIAAEASSQGLSVGLYEANDFAGATSSASSKLIHGGLRYLEYGEFRLVKEALAEREILLTKAAHLIKPMRFRLPHRPHLRPKWQIKAGLFLYDHLAKRCVLSPSRQIELSQRDGLAPDITTAFEYSDCWVDDARLVISNVKQANLEGAEVRNYCQVLKAERIAKLWKVTLFDQRTEQEYTRYSHTLVNATGPWAASFIEQYTPETSPHAMRLVKGSHLIVPQMYQGEHAYVLQNQDKRIVFVIPYLKRFSMIGTTDIPFHGDPATATTNEGEVEYLLTVCNQFFQRKLMANDVIDHFSGVRPLFDDDSASAQAVSRDYEIALQSVDGKLPLLSVFGGKLTTYRKLSVKAVKMLGGFLPSFPSVSATEPHHPLPGSLGYQQKTLVHQLSSTLPNLAVHTIERLVAQYGTSVWDVIKGADKDSQAIVADLHPFELDYLIHSEWALTVEDIVKRRTKLHYDCDNLDLTKLANKLAER